MDVHSKTHSILGIIDHGTRFAISLEAVRSASAIAILRVLFDVIVRFGKPRVLRTDNGSQFHSMLFRFALVLLGIRQQFSKPGMPWMNGRIERLFGTLKERLNHFYIADFPGLQLALAEFRVQYNLLRPHQHLGGRTPYEAWRKINPYQRPPKQIRYLVAWDGLLTGFYLQYYPIGRNDCLRRTKTLSAIKLVEMRLNAATLLKYRCFTLCMLHKTAFKVLIFRRERWFF
jgi:hypothetical protein